MALRKHGSLAIWSTEKNTDFEQLLSNSGFQVRRYKAKAYQANTSKSLFIWVAADDEKILPAGGEACLSGQREPREKRKTAR
jgi:hypothetical protein